MSLNGFDIGASGLYAQKVKMEAIASNIANINTTRDSNGNPAVYRRKDVAFSAIYNKKISNSANDDFNFDSDSSGISNTLSVRGGNEGFDLDGKVYLKGNVSYDNVNVANGVQVEQVQEDSNEPLKKVYNPSHPDADKDGYVNMPNVNMVTEMVDMISASRAYDANVTQIQTTKSMIGTALKI